jgi:hypothetical protein
VREPPSLTEFPSIILSPEFGQWWRIHGAEHGPWWFASSDDEGRAEHQIGRFDLPSPDGTCYLGAYLSSAAAESLLTTGVDHAEAQKAADQRRLSAMPLDRWYGERIADFTNEDVVSFGAPADIAGEDRASARPWALAVRAAGFAGIHYRLREDPLHRSGLALFGDRGEHPAPNQPPPVVLPVGLRNELSVLFDGEYRGDPLPG